jgi:hypothetical protein
VGLDRDEDQAGLVVAANAGNAVADVAAVARARFEKTPGEKIVCVKWCRPS